MWYGKVCTAVTYAVVFLLLFLLSLRLLLGLRLGLLDGLRIESDGLVDSLIQRSGLRRKLAFGIGGDIDIIRIMKCIGNRDVIGIEVTNFRCKG